MTSLEHMTQLIDRDTCNRLVPHAWVTFVIVSRLTSS